jgi:hypothetical protein
MQLAESDPVARRSATRFWARCSAIRCSCRRRCRSRCFRRCSTAIAAASRSATTWTTPSASRRSPALRIRTDLSATLFLADPEEYEGGELMIEDTYGVHSAKLPRGHMVLYPSTSLHHVKPVTSGARIASFFWIQSMVRDDGQRTLLFDLDTAIQRSRWTCRSIPPRAAHGGVPQPVAALGRGVTRGGVTPVRSASRALLVRAQDLPELEGVDVAEHRRARRQQRRRQEVGVELEGASTGA